MTHRNRITRLERLVADMVAPAGSHSPHREAIAASWASALAASAIEHAQAFGGSGLADQARRALAPLPDNSKILDLAAENAHRAAMGGRPRDHLVDAAIARILDTAGKRCLEEMAGRVPTSDDPAGIWVMWAIGHREVATT